jgi:hypothetical protein
MQNRKSNFFIDATRPAYVVLRFVFRIVNKVALGWLDICIQRKQDKSLLYDIQTNLHFLFPKGAVVKARWYRTLPFDYASVQIHYGNICLWITRGQEQLNVSLAPWHSQGERYEFIAVVAALDSTDATEQRSPRDLSQLYNVLRPRIDAINEAFSPDTYVKFKLKLSEAKRALHVQAKQAEWNLNKKLY